MKVEAQRTGYRWGSSLWFVWPFDNSHEGVSDSVTQVSQFTLLASTKKGNKPDFHNAAGGEEARELYDRFYSKVQELYDVEKVKNGIFQAMMEGIICHQSQTISHS